MFMLIGLVGKPSSGKSTFFKSATLADVLIAKYPFATIKPNQGIGYVKIKALCDELGVKCNPRTGYYQKGWRFVPVELIDVAGLVKGASEGKGLGNQFLDNLSSADAFIHIVDISGETDAEGKETKDYNPVKDVEILEEELDLWYLGILKKVWRSFSKKLQNTKAEFAKSIANQFSGLKVKEEIVKKIMLKLDYDFKKPFEWSEEKLKIFAHKLRHLSKPVVIAANKCDRPNAKTNLEKLKQNYPEIEIIPCSADFELALRQAHNNQLIRYIPGEADFEIIKENLDERKKEALEDIQKKVLDVYKNTGVQNILNYIVFNLLEYIAVFPAGSKLQDSKGNILPDCFLLPPGTTALDFAYYLHTDIGDNFIKAIDVRTKKAVGKEHLLKHRDGLEIMMR